MKSSELSSKINLKYWDDSCKIFAIPIRLIESHSARTVVRAGGEDDPLVWQVGPSANHSESSSIQPCTILALTGLSVRAMNFSKSAMASAFFPCSLYS